MLKFDSETWSKVKDEFHDLGRRNYEECKISGGDKPYSLHQEAFDYMESEGLLHVTTARDDGKLVGYVLTVLSPRHLMFDAFVSQTIGIYLKPEYRKGLNGVRLMDADEFHMMGLGVHKMYGGYTMEKDLEPLFLKRGWVLHEKHYTKAIRSNDG